jgi:hypothetical protein
MKTTDPTMLRITVDGDTFYTTAREFLADNAEDEETCEAVRELEPGGTVTLSFGHHVTALEPVAILSTVDGQDEPSATTTTDWLAENIDYLYPGICDDLARAMVSADDVEVGPFYIRGAR